MNRLRIYILNKVIQSQKGKNEQACSPHIHVYIKTNVHVDTEEQREKRTREHNY